MRTTRLAWTAGGVAVAALLSACSTDRSVAVNVPPQPAPVYSSATVAPAAPAPGYAAAPVGVELGRVTNIEYFPGGVSRSRPNVPGAILGAVAGGVLGHQIGSGSGRDAATILGGAAGAAVGSQVGRTTNVADAVYRVTIQTDGGVIRYYDVPATGDLHVGDRVRVENGVIYRA